MPDFPFSPRSSLTPHRSATSRVTPSDICVLRLSQTTFHDAAGGAEANMPSRNDTKSASERAFHTLQDRLPKEFKLAGIDTVEAANVWLRDSFIADYNERFAIGAEQEGSAFVADATGAWREIV